MLSIVIALAACSGEPQPTPAPPELESVQIEIAANGVQPALSVQVVVPHGTAGLDGFVEPMAGAMSTAVHHCRGSVEAPPSPGDVFQFSLRTGTGVRPVLASPEPDVFADCVVKHANSSALPGLGGPQVEAVVLLSMGGPEGGQ